MNRELIPHGVFRFSGAQLLASLVGLFLAYPFLQNRAWGYWGEYAASIMTTFILLSALLAVGGRRRTLIIGVVLMLPALVIHWLAFWTKLTQDEPIALISMALAVAFVIFHLLWFVLRAPQVNAEILCDGVSAYLLMGLFWALLFFLISNTVPHSFSFPGTSVGNPGTFTFFDALYFSISTLATVGYGDVAPVSPYARSLASLESVSGVLYVAILISRLVSLYSHSPHGQLPPSEPKH